ncbi:uncharacterized protein LOC122051557 [Zingiber officinale]|uniref:C2 domain-containing protein n=1 Tax=Zingiber officinale TaxID=94328 RepID=A0A8J5HFB3_ZINOF|nr:uncharacterized protein LOC122051557 [Zingiber officinale]KAG6520598.1 hypothetical protein ZIOFF_017657 [Zingiber officinale]
MSTTAVKCGSVHRPEAIATFNAAPFHLLELTIISAQELHPAARSTATYASAWVDPAHKLRTCLLDTTGHADPTWNHKFLFRVDDAFIASDTAAVDIHFLHARRLRRDRLLGIVRVVLSAALPRRVVALQVRRPSSLRPCGILNLSVALLGQHEKEMLLFYYDLSSSAASFSYEDLAGSKRHGGVSATGDQEKWKLERSKSVERECGLEEEEERERESMETKLEMWKLEMSPVQETMEEGQPGKRKKGTGFMRCFSCGV